MKSLACLALPFLLAGCLQGSDNFPSLAPRAYEVTQAQVADRPQGEALPPPPTAEVSPLSYEQRQAADTALATHERAEAAFRAALPTVRSNVSAASGGAPGTEGWVVAQQALSRLDIARSGSVSALADIDAVLAARLAQEQDGAAGNGAAALNETRQRIAAAVADQSAIIAGLAARLR